MPRHFIPVLATLLIPTALAAQVRVGSAAPSIDLDTWINVNGEPPTLESLKGRVVMLEFWGTWCAPCVRAMPEVQKLHERYEARGLTVLAISYEDKSVLEPFLRKNAYTMPVGADTKRAVVDAYPISGWPTTIVIDRDGRIAHIGSPYDAEQAVEKALGLEAGAATLLTQYLEAMRDPKALRPALERLAEKAPTAFDLRAWARSHASEAPVPDGTVPAVSDAPPPPVGKAMTQEEALALLRGCEQAWHKGTKARTDAAARLAASGPAAFDLAAFAREALARAFPIDVKEMRALLGDNKYSAVLEAIATRKPPAAVLGAAARDKGLAAYCKAKRSEAMLMAKKGVMAEGWVFAGCLPKDEAVNKQFFSELSVSGIATSDDKKSIVGIALGGAMVKNTEVDGFIKTQLSHAFCMGDLAEGKPPRVREVAAFVAKERKRLFDELAGRYGKPEPPARK